MTTRPAPGTTEAAAQYIRELIEWAQQNPAGIEHAIMNAVEMGKLIERDRVAKIMPPIIRSADDGKVALLDLTTFLLNGMSVGDVKELLAGRQSDGPLKPN